MQHEVHAAAPGGMESSPPPWVKPVRMDATRIGLQILKPFVIGQGHGEQHTATSTWQTLVTDTGCGPTGSTTAAGCRSAQPDEDHLGPTQSDLDDVAGGDLEPQLRLPWVWAAAFRAVGGSAAGPSRAFAAGGSRRPGGMGLSSIPSGSRRRPYPYDRRLG